MPGQTHPKPTLVVLAAGAGSRFGGVKQIAAVGPHGEALLEYSVHDAIRAGFGNTVFVINSAIEQAFREQVLCRFPESSNVRHTLQDSPRGTGHALLAAAEEVTEPFVVINADDFYGRGAFDAAYAALRQRRREGAYLLVSYPVAATLSPRGPVSRAVCELADERLTRIVEHANIERRNGRVTSAGSNVMTLDPETPVSMNFWGFTPDVFARLELLWRKSAHRVAGDGAWEFRLPDAINEMVQAGHADVEVIPAGEAWFGITHKADRDLVRRNIRRLVDNGVYPAPLWAD